MAKRIKLLLIQDIENTRLRWEPWASPNMLHRIKTTWFDVPDTLEIPTGEFFYHPDVYIIDEKNGNPVIRLRDGRKVTLLPFDWKAFIDKWGRSVDRDSLSEEQHREFIRDYYDACESLFPREKFKANSESDKQYDGKELIFIPSRECSDEEKVAAEPLEIPIWRMPLGGDNEPKTEIEAEAEEIFYFPTTENTYAACKDIASSLLKNYDEISAHEEPYISLGLARYHIPVKMFFPDQPDNVFIDEIWAELEDAENGCGLELAFAKPYDNPDDGSERTDSIPLEDVPFELLMRLRHITEYHIGAHVDCRENP